MDLSCPKCSKQLPEVETLEYRFCPHCGAEIPARPKKLEGAFQTLPPDLASKPQKKRPERLKPDISETASNISPATHQTIEPSPMTKRSRPKIKPPVTPPPPSFFRMRPEKKPPAPEDIKAQPSTKSRNIIIAALVLLAVIILVLGGFFTF
jgi:DNA-directed RNA polymerase subunit RPC12/RpoP